MPSDQNPDEWAALILGQWLNEAQTRVTQKLQQTQGEPNED